MATGSPTTVAGTRSSTEARSRSPFSRALASKRGHHVLDEVGEREWRLDEREAARFRLAQLEHVVQQSQHVSDDDLSSADETALRVGEVAAIEQLHDAHDGVERVADVVTQHRQQIGLVLRHLLRLCASPAAAHARSAFGRSKSNSVIRLNSGAPSRVAPLTRVHQHGQDAAVRADNLQRDLVGEPLHLQERRIVRLVIDPRADREERLELRAGKQHVTRAAPIQSRNVWLTLTIVPSGSVDR